MHMMPYFSKYMFMIVIGVYCDLHWKIGHPKILQLPILGTQFLNTGYDIDAQTDKQEQEIPRKLGRILTWQQR